MPKVTIVVPCFNQKEFVGETLDSVLQQTFTDWECVIVDDGSTDDSASVIKQYAQKDARFLPYTKENGGLATARNFGIAQARGEFIVPLDSDDILHPDFLKRCIECFESHTDTDLVHCKTKQFGEQRQIWDLPSYSYEKLLWRNMIVATSMFRRDAFMRTEGYAREMIYGLEDWEFYIRLLNPDSVVRFIDAPLFFYRTKKVSMTRTLHAEGRYEESMRMIFERNHDAYAPFMNNPIATFRHRMNDFAPLVRKRHKRSIRRLSTAYGVVIAVLLIAIAIQRFWV